MPQSPNTIAEIPKNSKPLKILNTESASAPLNNIIQTFLSWEIRQTASPNGTYTTCIISELCYYMLAN